MSRVWDTCNTGCLKKHQIFFRVIKIVFLKIALLEIRCLNSIIVIRHGPRCQALSWFSEIVSHKTLYQLQKAEFPAFT